MYRGYKAMKAKSDALADDGLFIQTVKYYCKGRGCRHHGLPEYKPTALCFYMLGANVTHAEVYSRIQDVLLMYPGAKIEQIQYVPLGVHLDTRGTENRWIITLNTIGARNYIAGTTLHLKGQKVTLRRYDDIIQLEYRKCSRSNAVQQMVAKIQNLDNSVAKSAIDGHKKSYVFNHD
ncbi:hypothetical protein DPMN_044777 [Dreissena polymorpha]|uniref:Uncharacterized protein n=1 Tax=Dreissena polymorpha TaxID=45954 RepID=A0A9D4D4R9_DREPO|nr:hypothetical protein DPMN_044777 [Dreissena polymorpha]